MNRIATLFLVSVSMMLFAGAAQANPAELKARMKARVAKLVPLKQAQAVGENNQGYLEIMPGKDVAAADRKLVGAENADRQAVYRLIAKKVGASAAQVGKRRAIDIAEEAATGTLIQGADGSWKTK